MSVNRLVLVDNRVPYYTKFLESLQPGVRYVPIIYAEDTYDTVLRWIRTYDCSFSSVAYVAHGLDAPTYSFMKKEQNCTLSAVESQDPQLASWQPFFEFVRQIPGLEYFDFMGCDLFSYPSWRYIFAGMESQTGIDVRASIDKTGNLAQGGNWILEEGNVNAKELYFTDELFNYIFLLGEVGGLRRLIFTGDRSRDLSSTWVITNNKVLPIKSGNIGVGITNPSRKLDVSGTMRVSGTVSYGSIVGENLNLWQSAASTLLYNGGNVGIGTSTPSSLLDVSGTVISSNLRASGNITLSNTALDLSRNMTSGNTSVSQMSQVSTFNYYGNTAFSQARNESNVTAGNMTIQGGLRNTGRVGVGKTFSTSYAMDVSGDLYSIDGVFSPFTMPTDYYETIRAYDMPTNESTTYSPYMSNFFTYIGMNRNVFINAYNSDTDSFSAAGVTGSRALTEFNLGTGIFAEKIYTTSTNIFILTTVGTVYSMGFNTQGQCGIGSTTNPISSPTRAFIQNSAGALITSPITKIIHSELNSRTYYALAQNGSLYSTGRNQYGQLGNGNQTDSGATHPHLVPVSNIVDAVSLGSFDGTNNPNTLAALDNLGQVWTVGYGERGQMGRGNTTVTNTTIDRVQVSAGVNLTGITKIYGYGGDSTTGFMAVHTNGDLYAWGRNGSNIKLNGTTNTTITYATKINQFVDASSPAISRVWTCTSDEGDIFVQATDDLVYATGTGTSQGILSNTSATWTRIRLFNTTTRLLVNLFTGCTDTSTPKATAFAITRNINTDEYTLWATGYNEFGQLGIGITDSPYLSWVEISFPSGMVKQIKRIISSSHGTRFTINTGNTYILLNSGEIYYCGLNIPLTNSTGTYIREFRQLTRVVSPEYN